MKNKSRNCILASIFCQLVFIILQTSDGHPIGNTGTPLKLSGSVNPAVNCSQEPAQLQLLTTAVSEMDLAKRFARDLVQQQLAAIVNIMPMDSALYMWEGELVESPEILLLIYSQECQLPNLEAYIRENHPDEEPGLAALQIVGGSASFLEWITNNSRPVNNTARLIT
ncbi:unnamed protein product [Orchesella dallaii]|uniref:Divalent-cation tolerance protein CutA n=1 Tax=Orchesella dallaii TaxID=48710 RepID=A0ABP1RLE6_9HEXA